MKLLSAKFVYDIVSDIIGYVSPLEQSVFVQLFLLQMTEIQLVVLLVMVGNTLVLVYLYDVTCDKLAACHVTFLIAKSMSFCKGGSIIMGRVEVGVPHMQLFWDSNVIKTNINRRSTLFLRS